MAPIIEIALPSRSIRGRKRPDMRPTIDAILLRMRTGAQWRTFERKSSLHRWFQALNQSGAWEALWMLMVDEAAKHGKVDDSKVFLDGNITKSPMGGRLTSPSPVHRSRLGSKRSVMTDGQGYPISICLSGANTHDSRMLEETLASRIVKLTNVDLVMDKGYRGRPALEICERHGFTRILPPARREPGDQRPTSPVDPRQKGRWKVERTFAWLNAFRGLEHRYERKPENHLGLLHLWAAIVWWRRIQT